MTTLLDALRHASDRFLWAGELQKDELDAVPRGLPSIDGPQIATALETPDQRHPQHQRRILILLV